MPEAFAEVRAKVSIWCGVCEDVTEVGVVEGKDVWERVRCGTCGEWYLLKVEAEAE